MATDLADLPELRCPYCGKPLNSDEYEHAVEEFKNSAAAEYNEQQRKDKQRFEEEKQKLVQKHTEEKRTMHEELKVFYDKQVQDLKKSYEDLDSRRRDDLMESLTQKKAEYDHKLQEKDTQLRELENGIIEFKRQAVEEAHKTVCNEIEMRDIQINRLQGKVEELVKQLTETQSELKGEVGEVNLLRILEDAFKEKGDLIVKRPRGSLGPEIIHHIRTSTGQLLENKIGYDNKEGRAQDLEKAKRDKKKFELDHFIIVSRNLPKRGCPSQFYAEKEGIHILHPDIVAPVVSIMRQASIEISRQSGSMLDQQTKEAKIFDLVRSREFNTDIEAICEIHQKISNHHKKDRKHHETSWREEEKIQKDLMDTYVHVRSSIDAIIHPDPAIDNQNNLEPKDGTDSIKKKHTP